MNIAELTHGLIIDQPWIDLILDGQKTWEMRTTSTSKLGPIALIRKGSKAVCAVAELKGSVGPLTLEQLDANCDRHCIPPDVYRRSDYRWFHAWKIEDVHRLPSTVPYTHKSGAVIWVELDDSAREMIRAVFDQKDVQGFTDRSERLEVTTPQSSALWVPVAKDGSMFCPDECSRNGVYTVGDKGDEKRFSDFHQALEYLRTMPVARWRRPNSKGNWGIVSAVEWTD